MSAVEPDDTPGAGSESRLRRIDDVLVPRLQRMARPVGRALRWPGRWLRRFDEWFAGGRPARALRDHRGVAAFVIVAVAFTSAAVHAQRYPQLQERARQAAENQGAPAPGDGGVPGGGNDTDPVRAVGPLVAARVEPYVASRDEALAAAEAGEERLAVVSFRTFLEPEEVSALVDGLDVHLVQYRLPERTPRPAEVEVGSSGLVARLDEEVDRLVEELRAEEQEVQSTLDSGVEDETFRADYEARLDELTALRNTLTSDPAIVFAVVVAGPVEQLRALADHEQVRLVDLAPADVDVDATTFYGLLPTDQDRVSFGRGI